VPPSPRGISLGTGKSDDDVLGDALDDRVAAEEAVRPVGGAGGDDGAAPFVDSNDRVPLAPFLPFLVPFRIVGVPASGRGGEDLEALRRAIAVGRRRKSVAPLDLAAVALVADDGVLASEGFAAFQAGALEDPMVGAVGGEGATAIHVLTVALVVTAPEEADSGEGVFGTADEVVAPESGKQGVTLSGLEHGVGFVALFPAGECVSALLAPHLPAAGVAAEKGDIAPIADEGFEVIAHGGRPVFVVADAKDEAAVFENVRVEFEIAVGREGEPDPVLLRPVDEGLFPFPKQAPGWAVKGDAAALDLVAAVVSVEAEPAPVVVSVVGVGGELQENGCGIFGVGRFAQDEVAGAGRIRSAEGDVVVAAFPIDGDGDGDRSGPATAMGGGIVGDGMVFAGDAFVFPNGDASGAETCDLGGEGGCVGGDMEGQHFAGRVTDLAGVAGDGGWGLGMERNASDEEEKEWESFHCGNSKLRGTLLAALKWMRVGERLQDRADRI
jgi:hypothetical protein